MQTSVEKGNSFEDRVAILYRSMGYSVKVNRTSAGDKQTDIVALKSNPGSKPHVLFIECKAYSRKIDSKVVRQFVADFVSVAQKDYYTGGVLVSETPFTREAIEANTNRYCTLLTISDLENETLDPLTALSVFISRYEANEISSSYIPLKCKQNENDKSRRDLFGSVRNFLRGTTRLHVILGDFGTGKTTFLERLKYETVRERRPVGYIPILLPLRDFESTKSLEEFIERKAQHELDNRASFDWLTTQFSTGRLLPLLDGFDEMGSGERRKHFRSLMPLLLLCPKAIITCRPAYFVSDVEMMDVFNQESRFTVSLGPDELLPGSQNNHSDMSHLHENSSLSSWDTSTSHILSLSHRDISKYVRNYFEKQGKGVVSKEPIQKLINRIRNEYDLADLAQRPVLLNLIVKTLPSLPDDRPASPAIIYNTFTEQWMKRDYSKGRVRMVVPAKGKRNFSKSLAWDMYKADKATVPFLAIDEKIGSFFRNVTASREFLTTHMQFCSFLQRDELGNFRFSHKSFLEYFAASHLADALMNGDIKPFNEVDLSNEVSMFLGDIIHAKTDIQKTFARVLSKYFTASDKLRELTRIESNLLKVAGHTRLRIPLYRLSGLRMFYYKFISNSVTTWFDRCSLSGIYFSDCEIKGAKFNNCKADNVVTYRSTLKDCIFNVSKDSPDDTAFDFHDTQIVDCKIEENASFTLRTSNATGITCLPYQGEISIIKSEISASYFEGPGGLLETDRSRFKNVKFEGADSKAVTLEKYLAGIALRWNRDAHRKGLWKGNRFRNCIFTHWDFRQFDISETEFDNCTFVCCCFPEQSETGFSARSANRYKQCHFTGACVPMPKEEPADYASVAGVTWSKVTPFALLEEIKNQIVSQSRSDTLLERYNFQQPRFFGSFIEALKWNDNKVFDFVELLSPNLSH